MKDDVIFLMHDISHVDEYGRSIPETVKRQVFCTVRSASFSEFFNAGRIGLNPAYEFKVFSADYQGEDAVEYRGQVYSVYRTYEDGDYMELYVQREGGTYGTQESDA